MTKEQRQEFLEEFILDDIDWSEINHVTDLFQLAKTILEANGVSNLDWYEQRIIEGECEDEWACYQGYLEEKSEKFSW